MILANVFARRFPDRFTGTNWNWKNWRRFWLERLYTSATTAASRTWRARWLALKAKRQSWRYFLDQASVEFGRPPERLFLKLVQAWIG